MTKLLLRRGLALACLVVIGYVLLGGLRGAPLLAMGVLALPLLVVAAVYPTAFLVGAVALLPFSNDVSGGRIGLEVAASDVLLGIGGVGVLGMIALSRGPSPILKPLKPLGGVLVLYFAVLAFTVVAHLSRAGVTTFVQRLELVVIALLAGSLLAQSGRLWRALRLQTLAAAVLAVATVAVAVVGGTATGEFLGIQKNYAGQAIGVALLIVLSHDLVRPRLPLIGLLSVGLIGSLSRGAITAVAFALLVQSVGRPAGRRLRQFGLVLAASALAFATYTLLPASQQARFLDVTPGQDYGVNARVLYAEDAWDTFVAEPFVGVGPGNYYGTNELAQSTDPHNVLLLEAATGGVLLLAAFVVLNMVAFVVLFRRMRLHPLVLTAIVVQAATLLHGMVDVYWVRGTPVLGWILVGAALTVTQRAKDDAAAGNEPAREPSGATP